MLKAAVIGAGSMGRNHVRVYAEMEAIELVAVADPDEDAARRATRSYRLRVYADYRQMLDHEKPDLVSIAVPTEHHRPVACEVISRGIHALVEKPLALTRSDGELMLALADRNRVKLMVGYLERFNPAVIEMAARLGRQELGRVFQVHARRLSPFPERIRDIGVILDVATHDIDVMRYLLASEVHHVYAETERQAHARCEDLLSGLLRFDNGVIGVLDVNWLTPTKVRQLVVLGEGGMYLADYLTQDVYWYKNSTPPDSWHALGFFPGVWEGDMVKVYFRKVEPLRAELESFVTTVVEDCEPKISGRDALIALDLAETLIESARLHKPLSFGMHRTAQPRLMAAVPVRRGRSAAST